MSAAKTDQTGRLAHVAVTPIEEPYQLMAGGADRIVSKSWPPGSITVAFLPPPKIIPTEEIRRIKEHIRQSADGWFQSSLNIRLEWSDDEKNQKVSDAKIRIELGVDATAWSYVGTDALRVPNGKATMHFGINKELRRGDVLHEFGHALGLDHPHAYDTSKLNVDVISEELDYWSQDMIIHNILRPSAGNIPHAYDSKSIMHYSFPPRWFKDPIPQPTPGLCCQSIRPLMVANMYVYV